MSVVKSRREQYSDATREALLHAATRRFAEHGFAGTALEDVAADIRATRGAVYHHFPSKKSLFEAVFDELELDAIAQITAAAERAGDPWEAAISALDAFLRRCCDPSYGRIVWQEGPIALGWTRWTECEQKYAYGHINRLLGDLVEAGYLDPLPLDTATRIVFGLLSAAGQALATTPEPDKAHRAAEYAEVTTRLLHGLRTSS